MAGRLWYLGTVPLCMSSKSDFTDEPGAPERWCVWMYGGIGTGVCVSLFEISHPLQFILAKLPLFILPYLLSPCDVKNLLGSFYPPPLKQFPEERAHKK